MRHRAQLVANRLVYGQRATPYQVLADFAEDMAGQLDADVALDRMASVLAGATGAVRVEVWVRVGAQLRPQVTWPHSSTRCQMSWNVAFSRRNSIVRLTGRPPASRRGVPSRSNTVEWPPIHGQCALPLAKRQRPVTM